MHEIHIGKNSCKSVLGERCIGAAQSYRPNCTSLCPIHRHLVTPISANLQNWNISMPRVAAQAQGCRMRVRNLWRGKPEFLTYSLSLVLTQLKGTFPLLEEILFPHPPVSPTILYCISLGMHLSP